jgi:hypothetical protein
LVDVPGLQISWDHLYRAFRALVAGKDHVAGCAVRSVGQKDEVVRVAFEDGGKTLADLGRGRGAPGGERPVSW